MSPCQVTKRASQRRLARCSCMAPLSPSRTRRLRPFSVGHRMAKAEMDVVSCSLQTTSMTHAATRTTSLLYTWSVPKKHPTTPWDKQRMGQVLCPSSAIPMCKFPRLLQRESHTPSTGFGNGTRLQVSTQAYPRARTSTTAPVSMSTLPPPTSRLRLQNQSLHLVNKTPCLLLCQTSSPVLLS
jgi:hypothetical protein